MLKSQRGDTLISVLIALGIMGVLNLGMMYMFNNMMKSARTTQVVMEINQAQHEITQLLDNAPNCLSSIQGADVSQMPIKMASINEVVPTGTPVSRYYVDGQTTYGNRSFVIAGVNIGKQGDALTPNMVNVPLDIFLHFKVAVDAYGSPELNRRIGSLYVTTDGAGAITRCGMTPGIASTFAATQSFVLIANRNDGSSGPTGTCNGNGSTMQENCVHDNMVLVKTMAIAGDWSICALSGQQTTADDANMYDGCFVDQLTSTTWQIRSYHAGEDALLCRATCFR